MYVMIFMKVLNIIYITVSAFQRNDTREKTDLVFLRQRGDLGQKVIRIRLGMSIRMSARIRLLKRPD